jgi:hypothetical protein
MISVDPRGFDCGCSPYWLAAGPVGWVHSTGVSGAERSGTDVRCRTLTCRNGVLAGQRHFPGNFDTEAVAQRPSTALNGVKVQVEGTVEGDNLWFAEGERFLVTEARPARHDRDSRSDSFLRDGGRWAVRCVDFGEGLDSFRNEEVRSNSSAIG